MNSDESPDRDDELDPVLQRRFDELTARSAPHVWSRVQPESPVTPVANVLDPFSIAGGEPAELLVEDRVQSGSSSLLRAAAALVLLLGLGFWGLTLASDSDEGQIQIAEGGEPSTSSTMAEPSASECRPTQIASKLRPRVLFDYDSTASLEDLVARSEGRVIGRLVSAQGYDGGTILTIEGPDIERVWVPTRVPVGELSGFVIAFLSGESTGPSGTAGVVLPEGLWVACEPTEMTLPALMVPMEPGWLELQRQPITLDELWSLAASAEQAQSGIGPASYQSGGVVVYRISAGDVAFRLSVPQILGGDQLERQPSNSGGVFSISGEKFEAVLSLVADCSGEANPGAGLNSLGSFVEFQSDGVTVCRPEESLELTISSPLARPEDFDAFDIRNIGSQNFSLSWRFGPNIPDAGPWLFPDSIVTRVGDYALVGLDPSTLAETWRFESRSQLLRPTIKHSALLVEEVNPSQLLRLDPADGSILWNIPFADDGPVQFLVDGWGGRVLRFAEGDPLIPGQASAAENIDVSTGEILWRATGRDGGTWSQALPIQTNSLVFVGESVDDNQTSGVMTYAIDDTTGEILWVSEFEIGDARYTNEGEFIRFIVTDYGIALIIRTIDRGVIRVDPETGEILWSTVVQWGPIFGTSVDADGKTFGVALATPEGRVFLDLETGERLFD